MLNNLVPAAWLWLALIHLTPALALFRPALLTHLYGVASGSPLFLLMHHRAALFAGVFLACIWAAADTGPRPLAAVIAAISMLSFLGLYAAAGQPPALRTIALADLAGLPALAFVLYLAFAGGSR